MFPVRIKNISAYLSSWDCWDETFTAKLPVKNYPIMRLNGERKDFSGVRVGLIQAGKRLLFEAQGECIYDPKDPSRFIGGMTWFDELGEYEEVLAREHEAANEGKRLGEENQRLHAQEKAAVER